MATMQASELWVPASTSRGTASHSANFPRADDPNAPARGIAFALLPSLAIWAMVAVAALIVLS